AGDATRQNAALVRALDLSRELDLADKRASQQRKTFDGARTALLASIDDRMEGLSGQLASARTPADRTRVAALLRDLDNQQKQIEAERDEPALKLQLVHLPSITYDPRDTPETLNAKAQLLRAKAQQVDSTLARVDRQIATLDRQLRRARNVKSLETGLE